MTRRYAPVLSAAVVGFVLSLTRHLVPLLHHTVVPSPRTITLYLQLGQFVSFLLVYGLLFGVAYWAGRALDSRRESGFVAAATGVGGAVGYLVAFVAIVYPLGAIEFPGVLLTVVLVLGPPLGVAVELGVVAFAGLAVSQLQ